MNVFRTISAVLLALLVLVSSTSFTVGMHICMGNVQEVAIFGKADGCGMESKVAACEKHQTKPCCEDETFVHKGEDLKSSFEQLSFNPPIAVTITTSLALIAEIIPASHVSDLADTFYDPPLPTTDRVVALQVFLI